LGVQWGRKAEGIWKNDWKFLEIHQQVSSLVGMVVIKCFIVLEEGDMLQFFPFRLIIILGQVHFFF